MVEVIVLQRGKVVYMLTAKALANAILLDTKLTALLPVTVVIRT